MIILTFIIYVATNLITSPAFSLNNPFANMTSNKWTFGANVPTPRSEFAGTSINDEIYII